MVFHVTMRIGRWVQKLTDIRRFVSQALSMAALVAAAALIAPTASANPDLPTRTANFETIESGSLIIAMDQTLQPHATNIFNLKAYGLANHLLQNNVPLKWAIRVGKAKDAADFSANSTLLLPTAGSTTVRSFAGGPIIIPKAFVATATPLINTFNNALAAADRVDVYRLEANTSIDIRYTLTFKPEVGINTLNSIIHSRIFDEASFPDYTVSDISTITSGACFTMHTEPHNDGATAAEAGLVHSFVMDGGNFFAQCASTEHFEEVGLPTPTIPNTGRFQTTTGVTKNNSANALSYLNPDLAFSQYVGILNGGIGGSHRDWTIDGAFANNGHSHAHNTAAGITRHQATQSKLLSGVGGNTFYLGGHEYIANTIDNINGRRMLLNAALVPANRPGCGFDFSALTGLVYFDANRNGVRDSGENGLAGVTVTITPPGGGTPIVVITDSTGGYSATFTSVGTATVVVTPLTGHEVTTSNASQNVVTIAGGIANAANVGLFAGTTLKVTKISLLDVGSFTFTGTNGWASQTLTTVTAGTGVTGATQVLAAPGTATTITESAPPANFVLSAVSCTGLGSGGTETVNLTTRSVALDAAATANLANITCTFTNRRRQADLVLTKTNTPGVNGEVDQAADTVVSGDSVTYSVTVTNSGPDGADGALITDPAPTGMSCATASCTASGSAVCPTVTGAALVTELQGAGTTVPTLPSGGAVVIALQCTVN